MFWPYESVWTYTRRVPNVHAIWMSPIIYFERTFILFGGKYRSRSRDDRSTKLSNLIMKLDENSSQWSELGKLSQERSIIC